MKRISILAAVAALWLPAMAGPEWVPEVERLMDAGEFKQAERLMQRLPKAERRDRPARIGRRTAGADADQFHFAVLLSLFSVGRPT